jgi:hypothetical protein
VVVHAQVALEPDEGGHARIVGKLAAESALQRAMHPSPAGASVVRQLGSR